MPPLAFTRPTTRFVVVKSRDQQAVLHNTRDLPVGPRLVLINALRGYLAEFGIVAPKAPLALKPPSRLCRRFPTSCRS